MDDHPPCLWEQDRAVVLPREEEVGAWAGVVGARAHLGVRPGGHDEVGRRRDDLVVPVARSRREAFVALAVGRPVDVAAAAPALAVAAQRIHLVDLEKSTVAFNGLR